MAFRGTDPESYITEFALVYDDNCGVRNLKRVGEHRHAARLLRGKLEDVISRAVHDQVGEVRHARHRRQDL